METDRVLIIDPETNNPFFKRLATEGGIAVNPRREDLAGRLGRAGLPVVAIEELKEMGEKITGAPEQAPFEERIVVVVEYRDGTVIDVVRQVKPADRG
jgi:citrate lyase subunit alpha/citrate CoA-transferase